MAASGGCYGIYRGSYQGESSSYRLMWLLVVGAMVSTGAVIRERVVVIG